MDVFAENYDLMVGADYNKIVNFIDSAIKTYKPDSELICDLGCGTGTVALALSERGYDMIAIDSSEEMLVKAREKAESACDKNTMFLCQDIIDFELYGTVDVIYSTLDTINYILDKRDLNTLFKWVRNYLNYDGLFIFDINSQYKFESVLNNNTFVYDFDDMFCTWETERYLKNKYDHYLTYFVKNENGQYSRFDNIQQQRYYSMQEIKELFVKYDFEILATCDNYSDRPIGKKTERYTFILKTKKKCLDNSKTI